MNRGPDTDIINGMPLEKVNADRNTQQQIRDEALLKAKAEYFGISASNEGKKLIALVQEHLSRRIDELVQRDPEAATLINLLADIGIKETEGRKAAERLINMRIQQQE
jgi:hypothetical protein